MNTTIHNPTPTAPPRGDAVASQPVDVLQLKLRNAEAEVATLRAQVRLLSAANRQLAKRDTRASV